MVTDRNGTKMAPVLVSEAMRDRVALIKAQLQFVRGERVTYTTVLEELLRAYDVEELQEQVQEAQAKLPVKEPAE